MGAGASKNGGEAANFCEFLGNKQKLFTASMFSPETIKIPVLLFYLFYLCYIDLIGQSNRASNLFCTCMFYFMSFVLSPTEQCLNLAAIFVCFSFLVKNVSAVYSADRCNF